MTVTDKDGDSGTGSTTVTVETALETLTRVNAELGALSGLSGNNQRAVDRALRNLGRVLRASQWESDTTQLTDRSGVRAMGYLCTAIRDLGRANANATITAQQDLLRAQARGLAQRRLDTATDDGGNAGRLLQSQAHLADGDAKTDSADACEDYQDAWDDAARA